MSIVTNTKPTTIDEYIAAAPKQGQKMLQELRSILREVAPEAKEAIKWGSPVFEEKRILFAFTAFKSHLNFMPTRSTVDVFREELGKYKAGKDTIQFPYNQALPADLIRRIAEHRAHDVRENDARWMHG